MNVIEFIRDPRLINEQNLSPAQETIIKSIYGLSLDPEEHEIFQEITGLEFYPGREWSEITAILPRRSGKTNQISSNIAIYEACGRRHSPTSAAGARPTVMIIASEKARQARLCFDYILQKLRSSEILKALIENVTREEIRLTNGVSIMVFPCDSARVRGYSLLTLICDEVAAWRSEGVNPDTDIIDAARPGLEHEHSKLIKISTPGGMFGEIWEDHKNFYGKPNDDVLVFGSGGHDTRFFNPSYGQAKLDSLRRRKPLVYDTEHLAEFRKTHGMFDPAVIDAAVNPDRPLEIEPDSNLHYLAFTDVSGGGGNSSFALAIGHREAGRIVVDVVRSHAPKFNPAVVTAEYCALMKQYRIPQVTGDNFGGGLPANAFAEHSIFYEKCPLPKSDLYLACESVFNTNSVDLPNKELLLMQLKRLVRTPRSGGKDSVSARIPDDEANVVCGLVWMLKSTEHEFPLVPSLGLSEPVAETDKEKMDKESLAWLLGKPQKKRLQDGVDMENLEDEMEEMNREIEDEIRKGKKG